MGRVVVTMVAAMALALGWPSVALAQDGEAAPSVASMMERIGTGVDTLWVLLAAFLVFFMQAGFGMVEAGFIRAKNACNILTKNFVDYCTASLMFFNINHHTLFKISPAPLYILGFKKRQ